MEEAARTAGRKANSNAAGENFGGRACKPDSVPGDAVILPAAPGGDHSSRFRIAPELEQPTRGSETQLLRATSYGPGRPSPPIWPCSTRGFPCPGCCHPGGGLLPHLFTLAQCARPKEAGPWYYRGPAAEVQAHRRSVFCGTFRSCVSAAGFRLPQDATPWRYQARCPRAACPRGRAALGVRTFLPSAALTRGKPAITRLFRRAHYNSNRLKDWLGYREESNFSNSDSSRIATPSDLALSNLEPGSAPTTT